MGFWTDLFRAANPFAKEDLSTPQARERKAYKAAAAMYFLAGPRHDYKNMLRIALQQASKHRLKPGTQQKAWSEKYGFLLKYERTLQKEVDRAFKDAGGLPQDIKQRAEFLKSAESAQWARQYPPRNFAAFSSFSPQFIRKY
jgi:hypothetical protein